MQPYWKKFIFKTILYALAYFLIFFIVLCFTGNIIFMGSKGSIWPKVFITTEPVPFYPPYSFSHRVPVSFYFVASKKIDTPFIRRHKLFLIQDRRAIPYDYLMIAVNKMCWLEILNTHKRIRRHVFWEEDVNVITWNELIKSEKLSLNNRAEALEYSKFLIGASFCSLSFEKTWWKTLFLRSVKEIKYYDPSNKMYLQASKIIFPPKVEVNNGLYKVEMFTWRELGGALKKWELTFSNNGIIKDLKSSFIMKIDGFEIY